MNLVDIYDICVNDSDLLAFLQYKCLILNDKFCEQCQRNCYIIKRRNHFVFRCSRCSKTFSTSPKNYFFYNSHLSYDVALKLIYFFINDVSCKQAEHMLSISHKTTVEWYNFCREVCLIDILSSTKKIGGSGKIVEVDDSLFGKRKKHKGCNFDGKYVIGGVERGSYRCFLVLVQNRDSDTFCSILTEYIEAGSTVVTNDWEGYKDLSKLNFNHLIVNHSHNFEDPPSSPDSNKIGETWSQIKTEISSCGRSQDYFHSYIAKYLWIKNNSDENIFEKFLDTIAKHYH